MKINRILSIIMLLLDRKIVSAPELSKIFNVSVRTIYRDIDAISLAGIPVSTITGVKGGVSINEDFKIDKYLLSFPDITSTMLALTTMYPNLLEIDNSYILAKHKNLEAKKREQKKIELNNTASAIKITLRFRESNEGKLSEYYNLDIVSSDENGYYKAYIYIENNETGYNNLLLHGDKCECIDPIHVRKYLISKIENIAQNYKSGI